MLNPAKSQGIKASTQWHDPMDRIVCCRVRWPWPNRVGMKKSRQSTRVAGIPGNRLRIDQRFDLLFGDVHKCPAVLSKMHKM